MYLRFNRAYILILLALAFSEGCERGNNPVKSNDGVPPAVPTGLNVYYSRDGSVGLEWHHNAEPDLKGYNVYRKINNGNYSLLSFTGNFYFIDDSLSYNDTYFYRISAVDNNGLESAQSAEISANPVNKNPPLKPTGLIINARNWEGNLSIHLEWNANRAGDIAYYTIYRDTVAGFTPDSLKIIGTTGGIEFSDTTNLHFYTDYFYTIKAVDKGELSSVASDEVSDRIYESPLPLFPADNSYPGYFTSFKIKTIGTPADYEIVVQNNRYFGDFWSSKFHSNAVNDTIYVAFNPPYLYNSTYYWRIVTYSPGSDSPNSVSEQYSFTIK